jgi:hypothetical protein
MAALVAELPEQTARTRRPICSVVHFLLLIRTIRAKPAPGEWFRNDHGPGRIVVWQRRVSGVFQYMGSQPFPVLEQGAQRQGDLPVLVAFGPGRERAGISQDIAPVLDEFGFAVSG